MTSNDFSLLFAAFAGFVIAPALFIWGLAYLVKRNKSRRNGPGARSNIEPIDAASDEGTREAIRSGRLIEHRANNRVRPIADYATNDRNWRRERKYFEMLRVALFSRSSSKPIAAP